MARGLGRRVLFAGAAAIAAAALVDPVVETLSNARAFGAQAYTDGSNADVLPALALAGTFCFAFVVMLAYRMLFEQSGVARWCRATVPYLNEASIIRLIPAIFVGQICVLFTMETLEQRLVVGHAFGPLTWLGGPPQYSLLLHFIGCIAVTFVLSRALRAAANRVVRIVRTALRWLIVRRNLGAAPRCRELRIPMTRPLEPFVARLKGRAPPHPVV